MGESIDVLVTDHSIALHPKPPEAEKRLRDGRLPVMTIEEADGRVAAFAAVATGLIIGFLHERFIHVPIELLATYRKRLDPSSGWWRSVLASTGQPAQFGE
jgi:6-phosphofructokinase 1